MLLNVVKSVAGTQAAADVGAEMLVAEQLGERYGGATDRERYEAARAVIAGHAAELSRGHAMNEDRKGRRAKAQFVRDLVAREPALLERWADGLTNGTFGKTDQPGEVNRRLEAALDYYEGVVVTN